MEKYGVKTDDNLVKTAEDGVKRCPNCGAVLKQSNPPICPNCGSLPLEHNPDEKEARHG